jgi:hypothetical protein
MDTELREIEKIEKAAKAATGRLFVMSHIIDVRK